MNIFNIFFLSVTGYYWINPNLGPIYDVIKVRCDFRKKRVFTCVQPEVKTVSSYTSSIVRQNTS